ncbi:MAG: tRNA-dependent cyclodipeptide synthase [Microcoleaceae cyanobacterium MO_207.B10]|nr:tRNA-dependent cyclodipeptide synthase [Microcoleaceae cyanobacterium MO_207.B10]
MSSHIDEEKIVENFDWSNLSLEQLKLLQSQISKAINLKIRELNLPNTTTNTVQVHLYKATLAKVFPRRLHNSLFKYPKCVLGVSLGSKNFIDTNRLEACIKWISENFKACLVLVGDSVYRLTIIIRDGRKNNETRLKALDTGQQFINKNSLLFKQYSESCRFEFKLASEIEKRSEFNIYYEELQSLYQKNESFQSLVNSFAQTYLNRGKQVEKEGIDELGQHLAITYLLEESALFAYLAQAGWSVFVYPGSIKTFEEISEGLHPEVPSPLQQMIWVSLRLKQKSTSDNENIEEKITR